MNFCSTIDSFELSVFSKKGVIIFMVLFGMLSSNPFWSQPAYYLDLLPEHTWHTLFDRGKPKEVSSYTFGTGFMEKSEVDVKGYRCKLGAGFPIFDDVWLLGMGVCFGTKQFSQVNRNLDYLSSGRFFDYYQMGQELRLRQIGLNMKIENVGDWDSFFFGAGLDFCRNYFESSYKDEIFSGKGRTWSPDLKMGWRIPWETEFSVKIFIDMAYHNILVENIDWRSGDKVLNDFSGFRSNYWQLTLGLGFEFNDWR